MKKISETVLHKGNWLILKKAEFEHNENKIEWEFVERKHNKHAVVIIPKFKNTSKYILIKEYRIAIDKYVIAFPAGLVENDNIAENAERELYEETGYTGKVTKISPILYTNPAITKNTFQVAYMEVDEKDINNINPKQHLEAAEDISVLIVDTNEIQEFLIAQQKENTVIGSSVWYFFEKF